MRRCRWEFEFLTIVLKMWNLQQVTQLWRWWGWILLLHSRTITIRFRLLWRLVKPCIALLCILLIWCTSAFPVMGIIIKHQSGITTLLLLFSSSWFGPSGIWGSGVYGYCVEWFSCCVVVGLASGASSSALTNFLIVFLMNEYYSGRSFLSSFNAPIERKRERGRERVFSITQIMAWQRYAPLHRPDHFWIRGDSWDFWTWPGQPTNQPGSLKPNQCNDSLLNHLIVIVIASKLSVYSRSWYHILVVLNSQTHLLAIICFLMS